MAEDWRVTVQLREERHRLGLLTKLHVREVEEEARARFGDRIAVSGSGSQVFLYAGTESAAREATTLVAEVLEGEGIESDFKLERWHPTEQAWEDASVPLPATAEAVRAEHERLEQQEAADSLETGIAEWELRIEFPSHDEAAGFADRLEGEGFRHIVRRSHYLIVGAPNEEEAETVAARLQDELPADATIHVETGAGLAWEGMPANPFAIMGGLGG
jgi:hypothetical protein